MTTTSSTVPILTWNPNGLWKNGTPKHVNWGKKTKSEHLRKDVPLCLTYSTFIQRSFFSWTFGLLFGLAGRAGRPGRVSAGHRSGALGPGRSGRRLKSVELEDFKVELGVRNKKVCNRPYFSCLKLSFDLWRFFHKYRHITVELERHILSGSNMRPKLEQCGMTWLDPSMSINPWKGLVLGTTASEAKRLLGSEAIW